MVSSLSKSHIATCDVILIATCDVTDGYFAIEISVRIWYSWPLDLYKENVLILMFTIVCIIHLFNFFFSADPHIRCINFIRRRKENINIRRLPNPYEVTLNQARRKEPEKSAQENQE